MLGGNAGYDNRNRLPGLLVGESFSLVVAENHLVVRDLLNILREERHLSAAARRVDDELRHGEPRRPATQCLEDLADPGNSEWQRDVSVSYNNLGHVDLAVGNLGRARDACEKSLEIRARLAEADPDNKGWQLDLSMSYYNLGNVDVAAGNLNGARGSYEKCLKIREHLSEVDPGNSQWQQYLSASYMSVGDVLTRVQRSTEALTYFQKNLEITERLAALDPSNVVWRNDLARVKNRIVELQT